MSRRSQPQSVTDLPASAHDDRRSRMIKYTIAMGIRTLCVVSLFFVQGWWIPVVLAAAIVLPYIAVVVANVGTRPDSSGVVRPSPVALRAITPLLPAENPRES